MNTLRILLLATLFAPAAFAQTWTAQNSGTANDLNNVFARSATEAIAAGDNGTLLRTTNGGATWTQLPVGGFDFEGVGFNPSNTVGIVATDNGPVLRTTDGATYTLISTGSGDNLRDVSWGSNTAVFSVGREGDALRSTDAGLTWSVSSIPNIERLDAVSAVSATQAWVVGELGQIFVTTNGTTWTAQNSGTGADLSDVYMLNATTGYAVGSNNTILKTTNGGTTWTNVSNGNADGDGVHFVDVNTGWVVDNGGLIWFTDNGGATWNTQASGVGADLSGVHFANAGTGWAVGDFGAITKFTGPGGGCQQSITGTVDDNTPAPGQTIRFTLTVSNNANAPATLDLWLEALRNGNQVQRSRLASGTLPAGASTTRIVPVRVPGNTPSGTYVVNMIIGDFASDAECDSAPFTLTVGAPLTGGSAGADAQFEADAAGFFAADAATAQATVAPNPFAGRTQIRYTVEAETDVRLAVYDVLGREVAVLVNRRVEAGAHTATFDAQGLAAGTYVYRLTVGSEVQTGRMTVAR